MPGRLDDGAGEQAADLVTGQWNLVVWLGVACPVAVVIVRKAGASMARVTHRYQEAPAADLVLVQAGEFVTGLEILLHGPPAADDVDQGGKRDRAGA